MPTLAQIWPSVPGNWRPAIERPARPQWGDTWFGEDGNTVWYFANDTAYQIDTSHITKDLYDMPDDPTDQSAQTRAERARTAARDADARYRSTIHTEHWRTIRIDADGLDAGIYVELLRMITERWPRAKLAGGGIVVPEPGVTYSWDDLNRPGIPTGAVDDGGRRPAQPVPARGQQGDSSYWRQHFNEHIVIALADATRLPLVAVAELLAEQGRTSPDSHGTIAAFIQDRRLTQPGDWTTVSYWSADERKATVDALHRASGRTPGKVVQELARHGQRSASPAETVATFVHAEGMTSV